LKNGRSLDITPCTFQPFSSFIAGILSLQRCLLSLSFFHSISCKGYAPTMIYTYIYVICTKLKKGCTLELCKGAGLRISNNKLTAVIQLGCLHTDRLTRGVCMGGTLYPYVSMRNQKYLIFVEERKERRKENRVDIGSIAQPISGSLPHPISNLETYPFVAFFSDQYMPHSVDQSQRLVFGLRG
jgi:hypothetical protein